MTKVLLSSSSNARSTRIPCSVARALQSSERLASGLCAAYACRLFTLSGVVKADEALSDHCGVFKDKFEKGEEPSEVEEESGENIVRCDGRRCAVRGTRAGVE